jgi:Rieske Fe-S protein
MDGCSRRDALRLTAGCGLVALGAGGCSSSRAAGQQDQRGESPSPGGATTTPTLRKLAAVSAVRPDAPLDVSAAAGRPAYLVGSPESLRLLSGTCTHGGCLVGWRDDRNRFLCPCHGGTYDVQGAVVSGPPPRPLDELPVRIASGTVYLADAPGAS